MQRKKIYAIAFSILSFVVLLSLYLINPFSPIATEDEEEPEAEELVSITFSDEQKEKLNLNIEKASPKELDLRLTTRGKIILPPNNLAHILPKASGVAIQAEKNIGDYVEKGELLAVIESKEIADLKADYLTAAAKEKLYGALLENEKKLSEKQLSTKQDFLNLFSSYQEAKLTTFLAKEKLYALGVSTDDITALTDHEEPNLRRYEIYSPLSGIIINRDLTYGEYVDNDMPIYEIANLDPLWVEIGVYPNDLAKIKKGQLAEIYHNNNTAKARILTISPIINEDNFTAKAIAQIENPDNTWYVGSYVKVDIFANTLPVSLAVKKDALIEVDGKTCIFACTTDGFEKREVQTGQSDSEHVEITSGIALGEEYVNNAFMLKAEMGKNSVEDED